MWALLNKTRGQIGLTAYKDYIFGLLFYKYYFINIYQKRPHNGWEKFYEATLGKMFMVKIL